MLGMLGMGIKKKHLQLSRVNPSKPMSIFHDMLPKEMFCFRWTVSPEKLMFSCFFCLNGRIRG